MCKPFPFFFVEDFFGLHADGQATQISTSLARKSFDVFEVTHFIVFAFEVFQLAVFSMASSEECFTTHAADGAIVVTIDLFGLAGYKANLTDLDWVQVHFLKAYNKKGHYDSPEVTKVET